VLPREAGNENGAFGCKWGVLSDLELRAIAEVEAEEGASAHSCLGAHWSELAVAGEASAALFGSVPLPSGKAASTWVHEGGGAVAPADMLYAEDLLAKSAQDDELRLPTLRVVHARRLEEHAKWLTGQDQHNAASRRYKAMAKIAKDASNAPMAAHALSQLSYSLKMYGSHEEALTAAQEAVEMTMDPLAQFVLATVRLSSGLLDTDAALKAAEGQLLAARGRLPTDDLEYQRAKLHSELVMWRWISHRSIEKCRHVPDVARFLICTFAKLIF